MTSPRAARVPAVPCRPPLPATPCVRAHDRKAPPRTAAAPASSVRCSRRRIRWLDQRRRGDRVGQPRSRRREPRPAIDHAERVGVERPPRCLRSSARGTRRVGRDVDVGRALGLAGLARQAQVERLLDVFVLPRVRRRRSPLQHLEQQVRAAARAVLLLERGHVARAHRAAVVLAAFAEADAAQRRPSRATRRRPGTGSACPAEAARSRRRGGGFRWAGSASISLPGFIALPRIPDRLELAKGLHQLRPEHLRQQRTARLAVAVLARERAAVADDEVGRAIDELARNWRMPASLSRSKLTCMWMQPWPK